MPREISCASAIAAQRMAKSRSSVGARFGPSPDPLVVDGAGATGCGAAGTSKGAGVDGADPDARRRGRTRGCRRRGTRPAIPASCSTAAREDGAIGNDADRRSAGTARPSGPVHRCAPPRRALGWRPVGSEALESVGPPTWMLGTVTGGSTAPVSIGPSWIGGTVIAGSVMPGRFSSVSVTGVGHQVDRLHDGLGDLFDGLHDGLGDLVDRRGDRLGDLLNGLHDGLGDCVTVGRTGFVTCCTGGATVGTTGATTGFVVCSTVVVTGFVTRSVVATGFVTGATFVTGAVTCWIGAVTGCVMGASVFGRSSPDADAGRVFAISRNSASTSPAAPARSSQRTRLATSLRCGRIMRNFTPSGSNGSRQSQVRDSDGVTNGRGVRRNAPVLDCAGLYRDDHTRANQRCRRVSPFLVTGATTRLAGQAREHAHAMRSEAERNGQASCRQRWTGSSYIASRRSEPASAHR